ncbi:MAG: DUF4345 domain-containing protein [Chakrabartia sp.]
MLRLCLRFLAIVIAIVSLIHVFLGIGGEIYAGATVHPESLNDATLDSQNRFYGGAFMVYAVLLWVCASDMKRYRYILNLLLLCFFFAGAARFLSFFPHGWPSWQVTILWGVELILPPMIWLWAQAEAKRSPSAFIEKPLE